MMLHVSANPGLLILLAVLSLVAGIVRGFSGFGAPLVFVPLAGALLGPKIAAPLLLIMDGPIALPMLPHAWRNGNRREAGLMLLGSLAGIPLGTFVLLFADTTTLRWLIAAIIFAMLLLLLSGWRYRGRPHVGAMVIVGAVAGVTKGIAQIAGPPIAAYWMGMGRDAGEQRSNIVLFFAGSTLIAAVTYWYGGLMSGELFILALQLAVPYGIGLWLGSRWFHQVNEQVFQRAVLGLIALAVVVSLPIWL